MRHKQDQVPLIPTSHRLGQRCSRACCPRSAAEARPNVGRGRGRGPAGRCCVSGSLLRCAQSVRRHRHHAAADRRTRTAGGSLLHRGPDCGQGKPREHLPHRGGIKLSLVRAAARRF